MPATDRPHFVRLDDNRLLDIADRLEATAPGARLEAARLIRDLDKAISHCLAVKGSLGLSPWAVGVLHQAIVRHKGRADG